MGIATDGEPSQRTTVAWSAPARPTTDRMNHNVSGTSATEVTRTAHQWPTPSFAAPSPRAALSGVRRLGLRSVSITDLSDDEGDDPQQDRGGHRGRDHHAAAV